jgi:hypothetical protein
MGGEIRCLSPNFYWFGTQIHRYDRQSSIRPVHIAAGIERSSRPQKNSIANGFTVPVRVHRSASRTEPDIAATDKRPSIATIIDDEITLGHSICGWPKISIRIMVRIMFQFGSGGDHALSEKPEYLFSAQGVNEVFGILAACLIELPPVTVEQSVISRELGGRVHGYLGLNNLGSFDAVESGSVKAFSIAGDVPAATAVQPGAARVKLL